MPANSGWSHHSYGPASPTADLSNRSFVEELARAGRNSDAQHVRDLVSDSTLVLRDLEDVSDSYRLSLFWVRWSDIPPSAQGRSGLTIDSDIVAWIVVVFVGESLRRSILVDDVYTADGRRYLLAE